MITQVHTQVMLNHEHARASLCLPYPHFQKSCAFWFLTHNLKGRKEIRDCVSYPFLSFSSKALLLPVSTLRLDPENLFRPNARICQ